MKYQKAIKKLTQPPNRSVAGLEELCHSLQDKPVLAVLSHCWDSSISIENGDIGSNSLPTD